jgi:hypothetical protein
MSNGYYFISYAQADGREFALKVRESLHAVHISTWLDVYDIPDGSNWNYEIDEALNSASGVLVVLTAEAVLSHQVESEWNRALNRNRLIIPLIFENIEVPRALDLFNYISFADTLFEQGISILVSRISAGLGPHLDYLKKRLNAYIELQKKRPRYQYKIDDLEEAIKAYDGRIEAQQARITEWRASRLRVAAVDQNKSATLAKVVGRPPRGVTDFFKDRVEERRKLLQLLADTKTRLVSIIGRGGIGKTQIALKILRQLEQGCWPKDEEQRAVEGILYLSQQNTHITLERIFLSLAKLMDPEQEADFQRIWYSSSRDTAEKIELLLEGFDNGGLKILLLDNVEDLLSE